MKKFRALKGYIPERELNAYAVVSEFIQQQETLLRYLQQALQSDLSVRVPVSISTLIKLKLGDVLQFLIMHNERHILQARKNLVKGTTQPVDNI